MAGCADRVRPLVLVVACVAASGCTSGMLMQAGRTHERVVSYDRATLEGESLLLDYTVVRGDRDGRELGTEARTVAVEIADLQAEPDRFRQPVECAVREAPRGGEPVPIVTEAEAEAGPQLVVSLQDDRAKAFTLVGVPPAPGRFHSASLYRVHYEWWVYALLPITGAIDLASIVPQILVAPPLFVMCE